MNPYEMLRRAVLASALVSLAAGCTGSSSPGDAALDTPSTSDAARDGGAPTDVVTSPDVVDVVSPIDAGAMDVAQADARTPVDGQPGSDAADVPAVDVVVPVDVGLPVDVGAPVDVVLPQDVVRPGDAGAPCVHDTDCVGTGLRCGYLIADACSAAGACVMTPPPMACGVVLLEAGCGCDGSAVHWLGGCAPQYPNGYAPAPITHMGSCP